MSGEHRGRGLEIGASLANLSARLQYESTQFHMRPTARGRLVVGQRCIPSTFAAKYAATHSHIFPIISTPFREPPHVNPPSDAGARRRHRRRHHRMLGRVSPH
ncbi:hypothetical protein K788_0002786 [Paraburkholderia caribensis MBA4]|uniref:Uncharacterized protein n=1 Tax=Paraburkholderia caribensis MBA4 TaxID=1323664 RepID=A0A0P0RCX8_9BURK|nr:hypothetical protein K788_0002786 [Paraburkholderia caribensis MBA4]